MKILFTGGSSFTGYWFIKELASVGHDVIAVFRRRVEEYPDDTRRKRVEALMGVCRPLFGVSFGDDRFLALIGEGNWDLFCHHAAEVTNYKSVDFDVAGAVANNTYRLPRVLDALADVGCRKIAVTGTFSENDEGTGSRDRRAFNPYSLSKAFTWQLFRYHAEIRQLTLGKFVMPNPFGPFEEPRFTHYLMKCWFARSTAVVNTPSYIRDNMHISLLAKIYADFVGGLKDRMSRINPSGYVETQGDFTRRIANEMRPRLGLECKFELRRQIDFSEPHVRINTDIFNANALNWNETAAWDELGRYYTGLMKRHPD